MSRVLDLSNKKFSKLTVVNLSHINRGKDAVWLCLCDCGKQTLVISYNLRNGHTKSCGCERASSLRLTALRHGMAGSRFYGIFAHIRARCGNPADKSYKNYGGRGIKNIWGSFKEFHQDMYQSYCAHAEKYVEESTTIDRINNDGNYSKDNCRWSDWTTQNNNKRYKLKLHSDKRNYRKKPCSSCGAELNCCHRLNCSVLR